MKREFSEVIQTARKKALLTQEDFASSLGVAASTVNRWETGKAKPNLSTMKSIKKFCEENSYNYEEIESAWLDEADAG